MLSLKINDQIISHFSRASIQKHLDTIADGFSLSLHEDVKTLGDPESYLDKTVDVLIDNEPVIRGVIEKVTCSQGLQLSGREITCDLIDCEIEKKSQLNNITLSDLIRTLIAPYGLKIRSESSEKFKIFRTEEKETVFSALKRACTMKGTHLFSDGLGQIFLGNPGKLNAEDLRDGHNLLEKSVNLDNSKRFHSYVIVGKNVATGSGWSKKETRVKAEATDAGVRKTRKKIIKASEIDQDQANKLAQWEAASRRAKALTVSCSVQGWRQITGRLWLPGELARVIIPDFFIDTELMIKSASFEFDSESSGEITNLSLIHADALIPKPVIPKKEKKNTGGWGI